MRADRCVGKGVLDSRWCLLCLWWKSQSDGGQEGLKELICSSDCVRGQGEMRVTLISLPPPSLIRHLLISLKLFLGILCLAYILLSTVYFYIYMSKLEIFIFGSLAALFPVKGSWSSWNDFRLTDSSTNVSLCPVPSTDLKVVAPEAFMGVANFSTFLLDPLSGTLFLGARDAILAVDINKLDQMPRKVGRVCGRPERGHYIHHNIFLLRIRSYLMYR